MRHFVIARDPKLNQVVTWAAGDERFCQRYVKDLRKRGVMAWLEAGEDQPFPTPAEIVLA